MRLFDVCVFFFQKQKKTFVIQWLLFHYMIQHTMGTFELCWVKMKLI